MGLMDTATKLLWPEGAGALAAVGAHWMARGIDHQKGWVNPGKRMEDAVAAVGVVGGIVAVDQLKGDNKQIANGYFYTNFGLATTAVIDNYWAPKSVFTPKEPDLIPPIDRRMNARYQTKNLGNRNSRAMQSAEI